MAAKKWGGLIFAVAIALGFYAFLNFARPFLPDFEIFRGAYAPSPRDAIAISVTRTLSAMCVYSVILLALMHLSPLRSLFTDVWRAAPMQGWIAAIITAAIQITIIVFFFIGKDADIFEPSLFNAHVSLVTMLGGGVIEEIVHRGFVIIILLAVGFSRFSAIIISAALFAVNHMGWVSLEALTLANAFIVLSPLLGTFILGLAFGYTFAQSKCRLWPVIAAHSVINLVIEPWLVLALLGDRF